MFGMQFDHVGLIIVTNFLLYFKTLRFKFVSDDMTALHNPPVAKNFWHKWWLRLSGQLKKLSTSVHFLSGRSIHEKSEVHPTNIKKNSLYAIVTKTEEFDHFLALIIHTTICITIYFAFGASWISFVAAMLYSTNPANNQGTMWPSGRGYAIPILCLMLAFIFPYAGPFLLFLCSWYTIGFLAPLALIGSKVWWLLGFMPFIWYWHSRKYKKAIKFKHETEAFENDKKTSLFRRLVVYFKTYGFYIVWCLIPFRLTFYHNFLQSMAGNEMMRRRALSVDRYFWLGIF